MGNFEDLEVWRESKNLVVEVYKLTQGANFKRDFSLRDQIRRSAISVSSNLAEGEESGFEKSSIKFFFIANGSLAELRSQLEIAFMIDYIDTTEHKEIQESMIRLSKRIKSLIRYRKGKISNT